MESFYCSVKSFCEQSFRPLIAFIGFPQIFREFLILCSSFYLKLPFYRFVNVGCADWTISLTNVDQGQDKWQEGVLLWYLLFKQSPVSSWGWAAIVGKNTLPLAYPCFSLGSSTIATCFSTSRGKGVIDSQAVLNAAVLINCPDEPPCISSLPASSGSKFCHPPWATFTFTTVLSWMILDNVFLFFQLCFSVDLMPSACPISSMV